MDKYITNLSSKKLTTEENKVISLGLNFIPSKIHKKSNIEIALSHFERSNRLKYYFRNQPSTNSHPFRLKSSWQPPKASPLSESHLQRIRKTLSNPPTKNFYYNLNKKESTAIKNIQKDKSIIIKNADKGSGIVIENTTDYIKDGLDHQSDTKIYEKVSTDPTLSLTTAINEYTNCMHDKGIIDSATRDYLLLSKDNPPRTQQLYFLKKIHKNPIAVRPIVSGCGGPTEKISELIDYHLQPHVQLIQSYVKDSGHMINIVENLKLTSNCIHATIDVKSLYLNIPHNEGIQAVLNVLYYNNKDSHLIPIPTGTMKDLLKIVLTQNYFQFSHEMFHQIQGTAMGTKMAPAYANIFMAELENKLLDHYPIQPIVWKIYIDDVLCIWPGNKEDLDKFIRYLNRSHPSIKFTYECSNHTVDFLDLTIFKGDRYKHNYTLDIKPFFKKTNKFQYLHYTSAHPRNTFSSLLKGEHIRLLRACSDVTEYIEVHKKLYTAFKDRGYPKKRIRDVQKSVPYDTRQELLKQKERPDCLFETFLILEYTQDLDLKEIRKEVYRESNNSIPKCCLSFRKACNLRNKLVRAKLSDCKDPPQLAEPVIIKTTPNLDGRSAGCATSGCKCSSTNRMQDMQQKKPICRTNTEESIQKNSWTQSNQQDQNKPTSILTFSYST